MDFEFKIIKTSTKDGYPNIIELLHWEATGVLEEKTEVLTGTIMLPLIKESDLGFVSIEDIDEELLLSWAQSIINISELESILRNTLGVSQGESDEN